MSLSLLRRKKNAVGNIRDRGARLQFTAMKSYEIIRNAVDDLGVKAVAAGLKVSSALVYKWCEAPAEHDDPDGSGAKRRTRWIASASFIC